VNQVHKLLTGLSLVEGTTEVAGGGDAVLFLYATHLHTHVACLYDDHHAEGMEGLFDALLDLQRHAFLHLQTVTVDVDYAGYL
jgi:hypothetical protein